MGTSLVLAALALAFGAAPGGSGALARERPDGILVMSVLSPERAMVADPRTGATRAQRLPGGTLCYWPVLAAGNHVVFGGVRDRRPVALTLPLSMQGRPRPLGEASGMLGSATPGRVWLARWRTRAKRWSDRPVRVELREVDAAGHVTARIGGLSPRLAPLHAALPEGFVASEGRFLTLRTPGTGRPLLRMRDGWFAAAGRSSLVWCRGRCDALHVWRHGEDRLVRPPAGERPLQAVGALSPDERWFATAFGGRGRPRVAVVDLRSARWTWVPGARLGDYRAMAWSPSGRWLYFAAPDERPRAWRLGAATVDGLPVRPGGTIMSIATASG